MRLVAQMCGERLPTTAVDELRAARRRERRVRDGAAGRALDVRRRFIVGREFSAQAQHLRAAPVGHYRPRGSVAVWRRVRGLGDALES